MRSLHGTKAYSWGRAECSSVVSPAHARLKDVADSVGGDAVCVVSQETASGPGLKTEATRRYR